MFEFISREMSQYGIYIDKLSYKRIKDLKEKISSCDAFIGTRFHSVIFAVQACVPTLAFSWDWKARNFFDEAGLGDYVLDVKDLAFAKLLKAWGNLKRTYTPYCEKLADLNENYQVLAYQHFETMKRCL
jgi:polysaccharide pyruvyl transferase WcaK-like protein